MLSERRSECKELGNALRDAGTAWWVKLRNDELIPLEYLAAQERLPDATMFCIMPEGSDVDVELAYDGRTRRLQVTTTGPLWTREDGSTRDWGYDQHLMMRKLNIEGSVSGWGPFTKDGDTIANRETALSTEEIVAAFTGGLARAFEKKARLRTQSCELAVHAVGCRKLPERMFREIVEGAASRVVLDNFERVHVFDAGDRYYAAYGRY